MNNFISTGMAFSLIALSPSLLQTSPTFPSPSIINSDVEELTFEDTAQSEVLLAGSHDRYGNWHWSDGSVERCYNYDRGYYC